jgi:hypothetical protein
MRDRYKWLAAAVVAVAITFSASIVFVSAQGAQSKAPAPTAAPATRGQAPAPAAAPARGQTAAPTPARGQTAAATPARGRVDRIGGKPNFTGLWQAMTGANWDIQDHSSEAGPFYQLGAAFAVPAGQGIVEGNEIPYKPEALEQRRLNRLNRWTSDPEIKCYMPGIPRANYMPFPFQIVQGDSTIAFAYEFATSNRVVYVTNHRKAQVPAWMGTSNGHWEGDTLVVEVTGNWPESWFDRSGNFHSDALKVTERYTLRNPDVIDYEATIDDPKTFTRTWKVSFPIYRRLEKNARLLEFKCVEYSEELIYGHLRKPVN